MSLRRSDLIAAQVRSHATSAVSDRLRGPNAISFPNPRRAPRDLRLRLLEQDAGAGRAQIGAVLVSRPSIRTEPVIAPPMVLGARPTAHRHSVDLPLHSRRRADHAPRLDRQVHAAQRIVRVRRILVSDRRPWSGSLATTPRSRFTAATRVRRDCGRNKDDRQQRHSPTQCALRARVGIGAQHGSLARRGESACLERHGAMLDFSQGTQDERPGDGEHAARASEVAAFCVQSSRSLGLDDLARALREPRNRPDRGHEDERRPPAQAAPLEVVDELDRCAS